MDEFTHINGMDIEGVLNGGDLPVVVDGRFTGEIMLKSVSEYGLFVESFIHTWKSLGSSMANWFATH